MIKNIIFDLGNVLLDFNPIKYLNKKLPDKNAVERLYKEIFLSKEWALLDRGIITQDQVVSKFCTNYSEDADLINLCMDNWFELLTPIGGTVEILKELAGSGYKIFVLSNFHLLAYENIIKKYDFFNYFSGGIISYKENLLKPESEIYKRLSERYSINPSQSIFIDDSKANVDSARMLKFNGIIFETPESLRNDLIKYKVLKGGRI